MTNKNIKIIGICGAARSGKNTLAEVMSHIMVETPNEKYQNQVIATESFAAPIKSMVAMLLDFFGYGSIMDKTTQYPYLEGDSKEEVLEGLGVSTRALMQTLGTDWGRNMVSNTIWLDCMEGRIKQYNEAINHGFNGVVIFITDVRFDNEAELIKSVGGSVLKITTTRETDAVADHTSEGGVSDCLVDAYIANDKDRDHLKELALKYLEDFLGENLHDEVAPRIVNSGKDAG